MLLLSEINSGGKDESKGETDSANRTSAKGYAQSINILSSTINAAPELVMEEDERDEDGDDDDDDIDDDLSI